MNDWTRADDFGAEGSGALEWRLSQLSLCGRKSEGKEGGLKEKVQHGPFPPGIAQVRLISGDI